MEQTPSRLRLEAAHLWSKLTGRRARARAAAKRGFAAALARLGPDDVAVDLGANVGEFTRPMAETGAQVFAFEPDPHALTLLRRAVAGFDNVTVVPAAAGIEAGTARLYRKTSFAREPDRATKSSSLYAEKRNVRTEDALEIELRDFPAFLAGLDRDIALIKIDIEGGEVPLMEALLAAPVAARIGEVYVETHERGLPHLAARTAALRAATRGRRNPTVNWDWH
ncbi:FkbM family methyltransferase [Psychromarinibacter sp. C21-152]|uniref:FkbM family methyltransferase n=1 Tax=Psychromarinibacter sediminicola TaxID=3033385 RepID=A0AAE3NP94_9RHOB|nr:FkbM family methyltransferase [Psychromarinibacter sediminicola]MDF0601003.1 FkbM family methyltransferase [Psychromarinibacter sediminicola]